ncbi:hypothetical protein [Streptomyces cyslabdanicus]
MIVFSPFTGRRTAKCSPGTPPGEHFTGDHLPRLRAIMASR